MKKKILLINSDESVREIFQMYLELKHYEAYQAANGIKGLEKAKEVMPDLILLDVMLPDLNGCEVCRQLKEDVKTKDIPVLFISSLLETPEKIKALESGGVDFINSTADYAEILARIETHLKIKDLNQQLQDFNQELMLKQKVLDEDLQAAASIQQNLLPNHIPSIPNLKISWLCQPCELVGGDICSINLINRELSVFYVLDVSGHGVPSAMITVSLTQYLQQKQLLDFSLSPKQILTDLNQDYPFEKFNMFSTIFYMVVNSQSGKVVYSSAGHPPAVYLNPKRPFQLLQTAGAIIGLDSHFSYEEKEETLQDGEKIILYTDGIIEFSNDQGELYGCERFYNLLEQLKAYPVAEMTRLVTEALKDFGRGKSPKDDITVLGIEFKNLKQALLS